jgi:hypothetical protein
MQAQRIPAVDPMMFPEFVRTRPRLRYNDDPFALPVKQTTWEEEIAAGAMTVEEFVNEMKARIAKWPKPDSNA